MGLGKIMCEGCIYFVLKLYGLKGCGFVFFFLFNLCVLYFLRVSIVFIYRIIEIFKISFLYFKMNF